MDVYYWQVVIFHIYQHFLYYINNINKPGHYHFQYSEDHFLNKFFISNIFQITSLQLN